MIAFDTDQLDVANIQWDWWWVKVQSLSVKTVRNAWALISLAVDSHIWIKRNLD